MGARLKKGDTVMVISGKDKGKKGKIIKILEASAVVEKMNIAKKHQKPTKNFPGGIIEKPMPVNVSKLMLVCPKCNEATRIRFDRVEDKPVRKCVSCKEVLDKVK
jgi:large subunit ribosomal protein L24